MTSARLSEDEIILRRYSPYRDDHVMKDEGTGGYQLRPGAVLLKKSELGASVYRRRLLICQGLPDEVVREGQYVGVAETSVAAVNGLENELAVVSDPWPDGREALPTREVAHALIVPPTLFGASRKRKAEEALAGVFGGVLGPESFGPPPRG